jgi:DNA-binding NtrC family response regulator
MSRLSADERKTQRHGMPWKGKLLLVDDDVSHLQHYTTILDKLGYDVRPFSSYRDASACLEREIFDLVVVRPGDLHI